MKNNIVQKELFKEFEMPKKKKGAPQGILPKNYMFFNISYEQVVFIGIAVIMLMVLLFSLGVERGKYLAYSKTKSQKETLPKAVSVTEIKKELEVTKKVLETTELETTKSIESTKEKRLTDSKLFTIQVIAYRSKKSAQDELINLGKKGFNPFIIVGGNYYQICVGEYRNQKEADNDLRELKKSYKDSFIRKR